MVTVADPHRPGAEMNYYPGEVNIRIADVVVLNKIDSAYPEHIKTVRDNLQMINSKAVVVDGASPIRVDDESIIRGKRVLVIEDGPTLTHGEMKIGAGVVAAQKYGAAELVDPRPFVVGKLAETFRIYPNIGHLLPAMGYGDQQVKDLEATINKVDCDSVVIATPIDLNRLVKIKKPNTRVYYDLQEIGKPDLDDILAGFLKKHKITKKK
jgi:predicted GTPase